MSLDFDPATDYPLGSRRPDLVSTPGGVPLGELTLDAVRAGHVDAAEMRATAKTLRMQAEVARAAKRDALAENLERAAELTGVPDDLLLEVYTALRPRRATGEQLEDCAGRLEGLGAQRTADFVREAAAVYEERGLLAGA